MPNFDFETTVEANEALSSLFDMDTKEGQRNFESLLRDARIRERDEWFPVRHLGLRSLTEAQG